jgi:hypothetical protein
MDLYLVVESTQSKKVHPTQIHGIFITIAEAVSFSEINSGNYTSNIIEVKSRGSLKELLLISAPQATRQLIKTSCL